MYLYIHQMSACSAMHLPWNLTMFSSFGIQTKCTLIHILWNTVSIRKKQKIRFSRPHDNNNISYAPTFIIKLISLIFIKCQFCRWCHFIFAFCFALVWWFRVRLLVLKIYFSIWNMHLSLNRILFVLGIYVISIAGKCNSIF